MDIYEWISLVSTRTAISTIHARTHIHTQHSTGQDRTTQHSTKQTNKQSSRVKQATTPLAPLKKNTRRDATQHDTIRRPKKNPIRPRLQESKRFQNAISS
ncbi:hypothetical protein EYC84_009646 [Monilinia fructicola]|uniref:Uncharacterized protein n=1 Tax=Monilinia fructicola TaxID=38448 RepID=A0A5M9JF77_MONFR|nr:hypothetical protein EYC84_009646 [Monilinia fructicola]